MELFKKLFSKPDKAPSRRLDKLMRDLASSDNPNTREKFYKELLGSKLFLATPGIAAEGLPMNCPITLESEQSIGFIATTDPEGKSAMIVFTSEAALLAWRPVGCDY